MVVNVKAKKLGVDFDIEANRAKLGFRRIVIINDCGTQSLLREAGSDAEGKIFYELKVDGTEVITHGDGFKRYEIYKDDQDELVFEAV